MTALSLAHLTALDVAPPALFDLAAATGYQSVGIRILPAAPGAVAYALTPATLATWRARARDAGVGVYDVEFIPLTPDVQVEAYAPTLALAAELGAQRLNVSGDDADFARLVDRFGVICDLAGQFGLVVDLEFMRFRVLANLGQAVALVTKAGRANGKVLLDLLHFHRSGGTAEQLAATPGELFGSVQLCDARLADPGDAAIVAEAREGRLLPGEGELPLLDYLNALPLDIPMGVEVPTAATHPAWDAHERAQRASAAARAVLAARQPAR
ncbi:TIM barrel protein [uncultured Xylophilus sp.]|uniref:sugar phosphate isomerase/epimerase family protein n=1 Tax=uncultured Xylophilus sp. TaxID=296832 RepID=UPI0025E4BD73|nr:TIM barrel protein [uncultured Xylophilus sp.]